MSATDELRRLLDERGMEYETEDRPTIRYTEWGDWVFSEPLDAKPHTLGAQCELMRIPAAPEQAIAATLGRGTCRDVGKPAVFKCSECGWYSPVFTFGKEMPQFCPSCGRRVAHDGG